MQDDGNHEVENGSAAHNGSTPNDKREWSSLPVNQWIKRLKACLLSLVTSQKYGDIISGKDSKRISQRNRILASFATFLVLWYYNRRRRQHMRIFPSLLGLWNSLGSSADSDYRQAVSAPLSLLMDAAKLGTVNRAIISESAIAFEVDGAWKKSTLPPNSPSLQSTLLELLSEGGCSDVSALPDSIWSKLATPVLAALPFVYLAFLYRMMRNLHGKDDAARTYSNEPPWQRTTFADVAGLDHVVTEVSEIVTYLSNPALYHQLGARPPRGVLLYGPPGSGKTLIARAVAGEAHCSSFIACSGSDFVDTYVGRGASRVRKLFDRARREARGGSSLIFIDEIDALAKSRAFGNNDERDQTLNQLLAEMEGFAEHEDVTMIVIAATNRADVLDPAILRRFDRQVHVGYPDTEGREAILLVHARRIHCDVTQIDWKLLVSLTNDFSGADLRNVVNEAALLAVREKRSSVETHHLELAIERVLRMKANQNVDRPSASHFLMR